VAATSSSLSEFAIFLLVLLGATLIGAVVPLFIALPGSEGLGLTKWAVIAGMVCFIGPWGVLHPVWGYWLVTGCLWASLVIAHIRRHEADASLDSIWENARQQAEAEARREREEEFESQRERQRAYRDGADRTHRDGTGSYGRDDRKTSSQGTEDSPPRETPSRDYLDAAAILGVDVTDSVQVIEKAYRSWAKSLHPDRNPNPKDSEQQLKRINNARDTLLEYKRRAKS
jgi:DnaJ-domain-containing protein 1